VDRAIAPQGSHASIISKSYSLLGTCSNNPSTARVKKIVAPRDPVLRGNHVLTGTLSISDKQSRNKANNVIVHAKIIVAQGGRVLQDNLVLTGTFTILRRRKS
jgi:hypothetical protein